MQRLSATAIMLTVRRYFVDCYFPSAMKSAYRGIFALLFCGAFKLNYFKSVGAAGKSCFTLFAAIRHSSICSQTIFYKKIKTTQTYHFNERSGSFCSNAIKKR